MIVYRCAECTYSTTNVREADSHEGYRKHATIQSWQPDPTPEPVVANPDQLTLEIP